MRVRLLQDCDGPNPAFDGAAYAKARAEGREYKHPHSIIIPKGTEIEDKDAHILCERQYGNTRPLAEPIDDEAKAAHAKYLKEFEVRLEDLRLAAAEADPSTAYGRHMIDMAKVYGVAESDSDESEET